MVWELCWIVFGRNSEFLGLGKTKKTKQKQTKPTKHKARDREIEREREWHILISGNWFSWFGNCFYWFWWIVFRCFFDVSSMFRRCSCVWIQIVSICIRCFSMFLGPEPQEKRIKSRSQKRIETEEETSKKHRNDRYRRPACRSVGRFLFRVRLWWFRCFFDVSSFVSMRFWFLKFIRFPLIQVQET
jgi:hypothetical protein